MMISPLDWPPNNELDQVRSWLLSHLREFQSEREAASLSQILVEYLTGKNKVELLLNGHVFSEIELVRLKESLKKVLSNEPIQHVIGEAHFFGFDLQVSKDCLIPRPETEELVAWVLETTEPDTEILEVGSGSGCIPIALKSQLPNSNITSIDVSPDALNIAKANASKYKLSIEFLEASILDYQPDRKYDVIVSNPPYIPFSDGESMEENVLKHEPELALFVPNDDPLKFYKALLRVSKSNLNAKGRLFVEVHEGYADECKALFLSYFDQVIIRQDLQGKDRMIMATFS